MALYYYTKTIDIIDVKHLLAITASNRIYSIQFHYSNYTTGNDLYRPLSTSIGLITIITPHTIINISTLLMTVFIK